ncbi:hypothetical protein [Salipaludibacillus neizhouensis]|uniref:hypothetical protein n=1 Tax=Salipaludibacillus neizhouensis TaxID=885475 RepID=UPI0015FEBC9E|nr:hypothetical protein [Salipaludibacillus neizhouensis]
MIKCDKCNDQGKIVEDAFLGAYRLISCNCEGAKELRKKSIERFDRKYKHLVEKV